MVCNRCVWHEGHIFKLKQCTCTKTSGSVFFFYRIFLWGKILEQYLSSNKKPIEHLHREVLCCWAIFLTDGIFDKLLISSVIVLFIRLLFLFFLSLICLAVKYHYVKDPPYFMYELYIWTLLFNMNGYYWSFSAVFRKGDTFFFLLG